MAFRHEIQTAKLNVRSEVLTVVKMTMLFFWVITPCRFEGRYKCSGETNCFHLSILMYKDKIFHKSSFLSLTEMHIMSN